MKPENYPTEPQIIWDRFYEITQIPRPSRKEEKISEYIVNISKENGLNYKVDAEGNIVIYVPASSGYESNGTVIIQNHIDMVTVKTGDKEHNFETDPLSLFIEDGWLKADRTTLGSDNGIGVAAALSVISDKTMKHPALELLFTVDEETGLNGATNLDASMLSGTRMLNLDTEDWGELYIGCAGGLGYEMTRNFSTEKSLNQMYELTLSGLAGGHSGVQIHEQLGNALKLVTELFNASNELEIQIASINGGVAHNVIAREATASFSMKAENLLEFNNRMESAKRRWLKILPKTDSALELSLKETSQKEDVLTKESQKELLNLMTLFPHGAASYNLNQPADLVDLSSNMSVVNLNDGEFELIMSLRFFDREEAISMDQKIHAIGSVFNLEMKNILEYPSWRPDFDSKMLEFTSHIYEEKYGVKPEVKAIHAGLECGIIKDKLGQMDIISFGPTIKGAHSPTERLQINTVAPFYDLFKSVLEKM